MMKRVTNYLKKWILYPEKLVFAVSISDLTTGKYRQSLKKMIGAK